MGKLWDDRAPVDARGTLQKYVMRLRRLLGEGGETVIRTESGGYRTVVPARELDLAHFHDLVERAGRAGQRGDVAGEAAGLHEALGLWRTVPPLANVMSTSLQRVEVPRLVERYLQTLERELELEHGSADTATRLATEATALARANTLHLRLACALAVLSASHRHRDDLHRARAVADEALAVSLRCDYPLGHGLALVELGELELADGHHHRAEQRWRQADGLFHRHPIPPRPGDRGPAGHAGRGPRPRCAAPGLPGLRAIFEAGVLRPGSAETSTIPRARSS